MTAKIITALAILFVNLASGFVFFLMLGLSLNGFSERDTNLSFILYIVGVVVLTILSVGLGVLSIHLLVAKKGFGAVLATIGVSGLFSVVVVAADFVLILIGAIVASEVRKSHLP